MITTRGRLAVALTAMLLGGCGGESPDAYGTFEAAQEVVVSAEVAGLVVRFAAVEGERLASGTLVAEIDAGPLALQREELLAQLRTAQTRTREAAAQTGVIRAQLATAREEYARTLRLYQAEAATARQLNLAEGEVRVLEERLDAVQAQAASVGEEAGGADARIARIEDQIERSRVTNPVSGTVLATYVEPGEYARPGAPLYRIADLGTLSLRAYVSGGQLSRVRLGGEVQVRYDDGDGGLAAVPGRVVWVSSEAEFTPTPIQTREERTDRVYAVRVHVPNPDGAMKVGMPGELYLPAEGNGDAALGAGPEPGSGSAGP